MNETESNIQTNKGRAVSSIDELLAATASYPKSELPDGVSLNDLLKASIAGFTSRLQEDWKATLEVLQQQNAQYQKIWKIADLSVQPDVFEAQEKWRGFLASMDAIQKEQVEAIKRWLEASEVAHRSVAEAFVEMNAEADRMTQMAQLLKPPFDQSNG